MRVFCITLRYALHRYAIQPHLCSLLEAEDPVGAVTICPANMAMMLHAHSCGAGEMGVGCILEMVRVQGRSGKLTHESAILMRRESGVRLGVCTV